MMPPGAVSMVLSGATKRWLLGVGAACAVVGLALRLGDVLGLGEPERRHRPPVSTSPPAGRPAPPPGGAAAARAAAPARTAPAAAGEAPSPTPTRPAEGPGRQAAAGSAARKTPAGPQEPRAPRTRARGRSGRAGGSPPVAAGGGGSLEVATAGSSGAAGQRHTPSALGSTESRPPTAPAEETPPEPPPSALEGFSNGEADYPLDARVEVPELGGVSGSRGTVSLWLQPQWQPGNQDDAILAQLGDVLQLVKNVNFVRFELLHAEGMLGVGAPVDVWQAGEWHLVTATWNGNELALFLDGVLVNQTVQPIRIDLPADTRLSVGSDFPESRPVAPGVIGRLGLWGRPLGAEEVATAYATAIGDAR